MRVNAYRDGDPANDHEYDLAPGDAARRYCEEYEDADAPVNVVVVPVDAEAHALPGWRSDAEEPRYRMFVVRPRVE